MSALDWAVLLGTILFIVIYGIFRSRRKRNSHDFLAGDGTLKWWQIGIGVMATQASAITFISTPGQAYEDGMRFIQFYFGLPLAMIFISVVIIPIFYKLNIVTAYEYLENRFDLKVRWLTAIFFLVLRGLSAGITIYAPSIILSTVLHIDLNLTNLLIGALVVLYTVTGGAEAVNVTQRQQMAVMMGGMAIALGILIWKVTQFVSFPQAMNLAGRMGKMNFVDWKFDPSSRYNIWSGLIGGFFLSLSYFGTDQSQVGRYLGGKSVTESRLGLLFNGLFKIPMQLMILFIGVMVFVFYLFVQPPVYFNTTELNRLRQSEYAPQLQQLEKRYDAVFEERRRWAELQSSPESESLSRVLITSQIHEQEKEIRKEVKDLALKNNPQAVTKDADYVFIDFVLHHLPHGIIGLLFAVILCAAMSSKASELNALASSSLMDFYKRAIRPGASDKVYLRASKWLTVIWGVISIAFATLFSLFDNLIQAVNIVGSLFYGTMLGIFVTGFFLKQVKGNAVFLAGIITECIILVLYMLNESQIIQLQYLWLNPIGCLLVMGWALLLQYALPKSGRSRKMA